MKPNRISTKARSGWMLLGTVFGLLIVVPRDAQAQAGFGSRPVGTVVGMPLTRYAPFLIANLTRQRNVNFLHLSQTVVGYGNNAVITAGVNQNNNTQPADTVYFPAPGASVVGASTPSIYRQINRNDQYIEQNVIGAGNNAVVQVDVNQQNSGTYTPGRTRWIWVPESGLASFKGANSQVNINNTHIQQTVIGDNNTAVALVGTNQSNSLKLPGDPTVAGSLANTMVNINTNVVVQTVIGSGNTAVAQVNVNQQNGPV